MFSRIQNDGLPLSPTPLSSASSRADLAVNPVPTGAELPEQAVSGVSESQTATNENNARTASAAGAIDQIKKSFERVKTLEGADKQLEDIKARLLMGRHEVSTSDEVPPDAAKKAEQAVADLQQAVMFHPLKSVDTAIGREKDRSEPVRRPVELPPLKSSDDASAATNVVRPADRERVLDKIQNALDRIDRLQTKIGETRATAYDQMFNLSTSVSGLNTARNQVAESPYSLTSASTAVDNIMLNVKAAVMAHGKASTDIVRLILT